MYRSAYREDTRWRHIDSRKIRPLDSVILPPEVKDLLVADCVDFLKSETWYDVFLVCEIFPF